MAEKKDPRKVVHQYLMAYRAAPHKTTGLSPYEMMFGKHNLKKAKQKEDFSKKQQVKEKKLNK